jgi:hypothetical protein
MGTGTFDLRRLAHSRKTAKRRSTSFGTQSVKRVDGCEFQISVFYGCEKKIFGFNNLNNGIQLIE